ncbi:hypothetical protein, partial [Streptococcus oralis]|uniref:hypothetical protein n=1 Tax=Streptococcus oralis TaxID=1303 RepID=UPI0013E8FD81
MDKIKKYISFLMFPLLFLFLFLPSGRAQAATDVTSKAKFENLKITVAETGDPSTAIISESTKNVELKYSGEFSFSDV